MKKLYSVRTIILAGSLVLQLNTLCFLSRGAAGDVDLSFDPGSGVNGTVNSVVVQPDGKVLIGGDFTTVKGLARTGIARLNADGSGDPTFNAGAAGDGIRYISAVALQSDGKILVNNGSVIRLNSDGSYDGSFPLYPVVGDYPVTTSFAVQPDGKVLVAGYTVIETIDPDGYIVYSYPEHLTRDFADGSHDISFISGGDAGAGSSCMSQPDGKVLVWGTGIVRLNANGSLDNSFHSGVNGLIYSVFVQSDGKLLLGGWVIGNGTNLNAIARLNANGSLDGSFNPGAVKDALNWAPVQCVIVQSDSKVVIGGGFTTVNGTNRNGIARLNANGSLDNSFNPGPGEYGANSIGLQPDGKVLIAGTRDNMARLNADGSLDSGFQSGSGVTPSVYSLAVQPDGKVLIGGDFTTVRDLDRSGIARLNADGTVDASFNVTLYPDGPDNYGPTVFSVAVQSDGKVLVGGVFSALNGTNMQSGIIRLNANGSLDNSFKPGVSGSVYPITLQPDGKVLIGGGFIYTLINWTNYSSGIARLNADGSLDGSFNPGNAVGASSVALQPDGKVLVGGSLGVPGRNGITRLNANGSLDGSFNGGAGVEVFGYVTSVAWQLDGKVLVGGGFSTINGANRYGIARLNANGSLDNSYDSSTGADLVNSIRLQPDGKALIGGSFGIARLNADGSPDVSFNGAGINDDDYYPAVLCVALQSDGKVLIGGGFTSVNGEARPRVARLYGDSAVPALNIMRSNALVIVSWPSPSTGFVLQQGTNPNTTHWTTPSETVTDNGTTRFITVSPATGNRFFRLFKP